jgi:cytidine deaminase
MRPIITSSQLIAYENEQELDPVRAELLSKAKQAAAKAYAPYSKFKVGSAVLLSNGQVVIGSNQENAAYPLTMCGERVAIFAASAMYPDEKIEKVAITIISEKGNINKPVTPCGACRQTLLENEYRTQAAIELILQGDTGEVFVVNTVKDILPFIFDASFL